MKTHWPSFLLGTLFGIFLCFGALALGFILATL